MNDAQRTVDNIKVDFSSIPVHIKEELAAATLESVRSFLKQPGGREFIEEKKAERRKANGQ